MRSRQSAARARRTLGAVLLAVIAMPFRLLAGERDSPGEAGSCPPDDDVWTIVASLVPAASADLSDARSRVHLLDQGDRYEIRVTPVDKTTANRAVYDAERDCNRRARLAAEFIVLALMPPELTPGGEHPLPAQPSAAPPPAPAIVRPTPQAEPVPWRFDVSLAISDAPAIFDAPDVLALGAGLRGAIELPSFGLFVGAEVYPRADFDWSGVTVQLSRVPVMAGVRWVLVRGAPEFDVDVGPVLEWERYQGLNLRSSAVSTRLSPGAGARLIASFGLVPRLRAFAALDMIALPWAEPLLAAPQGSIASTPVVWTELSCGLAIGR